MNARLGIRSKKGRLVARRDLLTIAAGLLIVAGTAAGCAKNPTEVIITVTADATPASPITSLGVTLDAAGNQFLRNFASLASVPVDAAVAPFYFPTTVDFLIGKNEIVGQVTITIEGSDPLTSPTVLARGTGTVNVVHGSTVTTEVALTVLVPLPPDAGTTDDAATDDAAADAGAALPDASDAAAEGP